MPRRTRPRRASHSVGGRACNAPLQTRPKTRLRRARKNVPVDAPATRLQKKRACGRACDVQGHVQSGTLAYSHAGFLLAGRRAWITACARLLHGRAPVLSCVRSLRASVHHVFAALRLARACKRAWHGHRGRAWRRAWRAWQGA